MCVCVCVCVPSCLTLGGAMNSSPPGSSVHGISQTRILERVAISFSRGSSQSRIEPVSPASPTMAGRFFTTVSPGKTHNLDQIRSDQSLSCVQLFATPWIAAHQASLSITNSTVHPDSCPSSQWCHPAISSCVVPFSSYPQSLPASQSFPMSQLFAWGGQSTGVSALASFLPKKSQGWSPSEWAGWISLQSKGLSRVFSNTTVQKHQFFSAQKWK